jgi:hypothetical protein
MDWLGSAFVVDSLVPAWLHFVEPNQSRKTRLMTPRQFVLFVSGLILPALYQRTKFALHRLSFYTTPLREKSGLAIHHGHWGFLLAFMSMNLLVFGVHNGLSIGLAGFGWGLMLDEIVPMLKMPSSGRDLELAVYEQTRNPTIILISAILALSLVLFLVLR